MVLKTSYTIYIFKYFTYRWFAALFSIVIEHASAIKNEKSSFPVTPQIWGTFWEITLPNCLNLKFFFCYMQNLRRYYKIKCNWGQSAQQSLWLNLSLRSRLHNSLYHFMWTSTNSLYTISIRRSIRAVGRPPTLSINLPFVLLHPLIKSRLLVIGPFSWLLCISQDLWNNKEPAFKWQDRKD